jgi:hypothetical protein
LSQQSGHSQTKLYRIINHWLSEAQNQSENTLEQHRYLILDGTFLHRPVSIITLMDAETNKIIAGKYGVSENSERQLLSFFKPLIARGLKPISCTVDGNRTAMRVMEELWPGIVIQRCVVHIQRQGLSWCRMYPKTAAARGMRKLFLQVTGIKNEEERDKFFESINKWEQKYGRYIEAHPEKGRVFSDLKRARSVLIKALPRMFRYLEDPKISSTSNGLEGYFSRLKSHYRQHRGLKKEKLNSYFNWYFYFCPK